MKDRYAREVINGFPYPVAAMFVRLRTDECLDPGPNRLRYLLSTGEAITRFLGVVNLCQARSFAESTGHVPPHALCADFRLRFERIAWGTWLHLARESLRWLLTEPQATVLIPEMGRFFFDPPPADSRAVKALGELLTLRNGLSHDKIKVMHAHEFQDLCGRAQEHLETVLEALEFLLDYELTFISEIDVEKRRRHEPVFRHRLMKLIGNSGDFEGDRNKQTFPLDSHAVILSHRESGRHLNLDPLLVYEAKAGKAPDIFFYNGMRSPDQAEYAACKHGGNFRGGDSERAANLAEELSILLQMFGDTTAAPSALV
ncbi:MAG: hypothetical protein AW09_002670 [Candidatus Accumulibacter phosphatis]|uniref:Uncharacterized protein n=1 Tax=Candidatus Accumulibacter phosphatis TaxID=327160 RepID=A0A080LU96_9PROT|nr:hypothetical protein [Accumulibacter sp.]KFB72157.1 MAG: hypothetical protein AW09_002670 [Candidatus Accumulibacter phosphatis]HRF12006.1 hypothetical protein [Candidatus Accumulibacter phosphatis]